MREKEDKSVATITIPFFKAQQSLLDLTGDSRAYEALVKSSKSSWQELERSVIETVHGPEFVHLSQTCQSIYGPLSHNLLVPQVNIFARKFKYLKILNHRLKIIK